MACVLERNKVLWQQGVLFYIKFVLRIPAMTFSSRGIWKTDVATYGASQKMEGNKYLWKNLQRNLFFKCYHLYGTPASKININTYGI